MKIRVYWILIILILLSLQSCYVLKQGIGQMERRFAQVPLEKAIETEKNQEYKKLLSSVDQIKQFAVSHLYLKQNDNYKTYLSTPEEGVAFVVTASSKIKLVPYTWWFPVIGSVPYKGFFDRKDALEQEQELVNQGYDTWLFAAPAYSTLGWFDDPVTTPMLKRGYYALAESLIHEMVHSTLYVEGESDFNEQLASFIEKRGTVEYFRQQGLLTEELENKIQMRDKARKAFVLVTQKYIEQLKALYSEDMNDQIKLEQRQKIFDQLKTKVENIYPGRPDNYWEFNNARLLQYKRYHEDSELLTGFWEESKGDWKLFWQQVRTYVKKQGWET